MVDWRENLKSTVSKIHVLSSFYLFSNFLERVGFLKFKLNEIFIVKIKTRTLGYFYSVIQGTINAKNHP